MQIPQEQGLGHRHPRPVAGLCSMGSSMSVMGVKVDPKGNRCLQGFPKERWTPGDLTTKIPMRISVHVSAQPSPPQGTAAGGKEAMEESHPEHKKGHVR